LICPSPEHRPWNAESVSVGEGNYSLVFSFVNNLTSVAEISTKQRKREQQLDRTGPESIHREPCRRD
jgi:hypothetical protein